VGGIPTVVRDDVNGKLFANDDARFCSDCCSYVIDLMRDPAAYRDLALSSFFEFEDHLNWEVAGGTLKRLIEMAL